MSNLSAWIALVFVLHNSIAGVWSQSDWELALDEEFNTFDLSLWRHEITLAGGGNWEFQAYSNNRSNSYVKDGVLYIQPTLLSDDIGEDNVVKSGTTLDYLGRNTSRLMHC